MGPYSRHLILSSLIHNRRIRGARQYVGRPVIIQYVKVNRRIEAAELNGLAAGELCQQSAAGLDIVGLCAVTPLIMTSHESASDIPCAWPRSFLGYSMSAGLLLYDGSRPNCPHVTATGATRIQSASHHPEASMSRTSGASRRWTGERRAPKRCWTDAQEPQKNGHAPRQGADRTSVPFAAADPTMRPFAFGYASWPRSSAVRLSMAARPAQARRHCHESQNAPSSLLRGAAASTLDFGPPVRWAPDGRRFRILAIVDDFTRGLPSAHRRHLTAGPAGRSQTQNPYRDPRPPCRVQERRRWLCGCTFTTPSARTALPPAVHAWRSRNAVGRDAALIRAGNLYPLLPRYKFGLRRIILSLESRSFKLLRTVGFCGSRS
jgi:hypothetical protein